ncbi:DUF3737 family protein [Clostridium saudiense]|uniref:DUF3737 family protein n=1 Tax=Clostridium saudiense TaxID=1414720 RepID=UPI0018AA8CA6|nr:DUF3737 family protein [Clostridium saudiense]
MSKVIEEQFLTGERALFGAKDMKINYTTFDDGESPLKESSDISLYYSMFKWKYPVWYSKNIFMNDCTLFETARSGIWYTDNISLTNCIVEAPKTFRRASNIKLKNVSMPNAEETLWNCRDIKMENVTAKGNYFAMNSENIQINKFELVGNYSFDGSKNIEIRNAKLLSKDAFWNCENVTVYDSFISGEYLGWNSKNVTFINCTIESLQGMCYMDNIVMKNCRLLNTTLAFEYSIVDARVNGTINSILNPISGIIEADVIGELTLDKTKINPEKTKIRTGEFENAI